MRVLLSLIGLMLLLLNSCVKEPPSHPFPGGRPAGLGTATFGFYLSMSNFQVDSLRVKYGSKNGPHIFILQDTILSFLTQWRSLEFAYQKGDSIWADVQAWGTLKEALLSQTGIGKLSFDTVYWYDALPIRDTIWEDSFVSMDTISGTPFSYHAFKAVTF